MSDIKPALIDFPMPITTPRLMLRPASRCDGKDLSNALAESFLDLYPWIPWARRNITVEQAEEFVRQIEANWLLKNNKSLGLVIFMFEKDHPEKLIGSIALQEIDWNVPRMEVGYWIRTGYSGKGYMIEAINATTQYVFKEMKMRRVEIHCNPKNAKSIKIAQKLKYNLEARLKDNYVDHVSGNLADTLIFVRHNVTGLPPLEVLWPERQSCV